MTAIRLEAPDDLPAIRALHLASFPTEREARLVELLRDAGRLSISLVAEVDGAVVGHVAFSPVTAECGAAGLGLAPLAVLPDNRRQGIASELVRRGLERCASLGCGWAAVLGDPAYYGRFGFSAAQGFGLMDEYGGGAAFQAVELAEGSLPIGGGLVGYRAEFDSLA